MLDFYYCHSAKLDKSIVLVAVILEWFHCWTPHGDFEEKFAIFNSEVTLGTRYIGIYWSLLAVHSHEIPGVHFKIRNYISSTFGIQIGDFVLHSFWSVQNSGPKHCWRNPMCWRDHQFSTQPWGVPSRPGVQSRLSRLLATDSFDDCLAHSSSFISNLRVRVWKTNSSWKEAKCTTMYKDKAGCQDV